MLYFIEHPASKRIIQVVAELTDALRADGRDVSRWDIKTMERAKDIALQANLLEDGYFYLSCDRGSYVSPRYDVIRAPMKGAEVSKGFNGDYYPCGKIAKVTHNFKRVETADGTVFWRRKESDVWLEQGGGFAMCYGVHDERNPSF